MFNFYEAIAERISAQADEYEALQSNVQQRALSALFDPFQILQPARATVPSTNATELAPPKLPTERRERRKARPATRTKIGSTKRPALNFA